MDMTLAAIVLALLLVVALGLHEAKRREVKQLQHSLDSLTAHITQVRKLAYDDGFTSGLKHGLGDMYKAIRRAEREGRDPIEAAAALGRITAAAVGEIED